MTQQLYTTVVPEWTLGDRLRKAREMTGLEATQFADEIGVHRQSIANYEKGKTRPRRIVLQAWAVRTGVSLEWLQTGVNPRPDEPDRGLDQVRHQGLEPRTRWFADDDVSRSVAA